MSSLKTFLSIALLSALLAGGCTAKCRELEPESDVRDSLRERVDDELDVADVSDAQREKIQALFARALPARMHFRAQTVPLLHDLVAELRREPADHKRQAALLVKLADEGERYGHVVADIMLQAHPILTAEQRKKLAAKASEPSPPFDGSWFLDRGVDLLVMRVRANTTQEALVRRMKQHFVKQARELQRKLDGLRGEAAAELSKDQPDAARVHALLKRARGETERIMLELAGYEQLLASKLDPSQRALLNAELVRLQVCAPDKPASKMSLGLQSPPIGLRPTGALISGP